MPGPIQPDVVYRLPSVGDPALSPDGSLLAYTYSWVDQEQMEPCSRIMMMRLSDGEAREFTQGKSDSAPKFSLDGGSLAFLRRDPGGRRGLWVMDVGGGEARRLNTGAASVSDFAWSPDGRRMVYCADVEPTSSAEEKQPGDIPQVKVVNRIRYRFDGLGWRGDAHSHLFVTGLDGEEPAQLTDGDWDDVAPIWSPDGGRIAFISGQRVDRDRLALTQVYVVSAEGGRRRMLVGRPDRRGRPGLVARRPAAGCSRVRDSPGDVAVAVVAVRVGTGPRAAAFDRRFTAPIAEFPGRYPAAGVAVDRGQPHHFSGRPAGGVLAGGSHGVGWGRATAGRRRLPEQQLGSRWRCQDCGGSFLISQVARRTVPRGLGFGGPTATYQLQPGIPGGASAGVDGEVQRRAGRLGNRVPLVASSRVRPRPTLSPGA